MKEMSVSKNRKFYKNNNIPEDNYILENVKSISLLSYGLVLQFTYFFPNLM